MGDIAIDTCNMPLNRLKTERALIGRRANERDYRSYGQLIWDYFMKGCEIEDPELAKALKKARRERFIVNASIVAVGVTAVFQTTLYQEGKARSRPQFVRTSTVRCIRRQEPIVA